MHVIQVLYYWTTSPVLRFLRYSLLMQPWLASNLWFFRLRLLRLGLWEGTTTPIHFLQRILGKLAWAEIVMIVRLVHGRLYLHCWSWQSLTKYSPRQEFYEANSFILGPLFFSWAVHHFHVQKPRHIEERFMPKGTRLLSGAFWLVIIIIEDKCYSSYFVLSVRPGKAKTAACPWAPSYSRALKQSVQSEHHFKDS